MARLETKILANNNNEAAFLGIKSPDEVLRAILNQLNEWISLIPNLFHSLGAKFDEVFPPETRAHWAAVAAQWAEVTVGVIALCLFCFCCFPAIICCFSVIISFIISVVVTILNLISLVFVFLWRMLCGVFRGCCCCGRQSLKLMKAPGRGGRMVLQRSVFESNPASYFRGLRAGSLPSSYSYVS